MSHDPTGPPFSDFYVGLDLGQSADWTALAVLERTENAGGDPGERWKYDLVHLQRIALGTSYPAVANSVAELMARPELHRPRLVTGDRGPTSAAIREAPLPWLCIDATGVGRAVVDMFAQKPMPCRLAAVSITAGVASRCEEWGRVERKRGGFGRRAAESETVKIAGHWVAKLQLVGTTLALFQTRRLRIVPGLPDAETLRDELRTFQTKLTATGAETFGHREGKHDDLVLAVACAAWVAEYAPAHPGPLVRGPSPLAGWRASRSSFGRG